MARRPMMEHNGVMSVRYDSTWVKGRGGRTGFRKGKERKTEKRDKDTNRAIEEEEGVKGHGERGGRQRREGEGKRSLGGGVEGGEVDRGGMDKAAREGEVGWGKEE